MKPTNAVPLALTPVTLEQVKRFVGTNHRHNQAPKRYRFAVAVKNSETGEIVGVAAAAQPVARLLDDGSTVEVIRSCTDGTPNANSMLYGALTRAAKSLGFARLITYTLENESGSSLRAAGWSIDREGLAPQTWNRPNRHRNDVDMFGSRLPPTVNRIRWVKSL
jgi:hypothetical protein